MDRITIKIMTEEALAHLNKNIKTITKKVIENNDNKWIYEEFPKPIFIEKKHEIKDFELQNNPESENKDIDFNNSLVLYNSLKSLPRYILCDQGFWLWLHFEKFYSIVKEMLPIKNSTTISNMWTHSQGVRRGIMFGVLSRCYFRVALSIDDNLEDKYELTRWIIDNPLRFRELTWRTYSSEEHIVRGAIKGEKRAVEELGYEENIAYPQIAKYISRIGSAQLLDIVSEEEISQKVYDKTIELMAKNN